MKYLYTALFLFAITKLSFAQVACSQYNGDFNKIKNELISRARAAGAYQPDLTKKKGDLASFEKYEAAWTDESINQIAQTWVLICRCESAGITPSEWAGSEYDDGWAINKPLTDNDYIVQGQIKQKDESVFGDLAKSSKIYTSVDCTGGDKFAPRTSCGQKTFTKSEDPQNYANAYMFARCQCEEGVSTEERAKQLEYEMKENLANAKSYHGNNLNIPEPALKWTDCVKAGTGQVGNAGYVDPNGELKSATVDLMNLWASETDNEKVKQISNNLNETRSWVDKFKQMDPSNAEGFDQIETYAMGAAIIAGMFKNSKSISPTSKYWIDGKWHELSQEEVDKMGLRILKEPFHSINDVRELEMEIQKHIGLDELFEKRFNTYIEILKNLDLISINDFQTLKIDIYLSEITRDTKERSIAWVKLYEQFSSSDSLINELSELDNQITEMLVLQQSIFKELVTNLYLEMNPGFTQKEIFAIYEDMWNSGNMYFLHFELLGSVEDYVHIKNDLVPIELKRFWDDPRLEILERYNTHVLGRVDISSLSNFSLMPISIMHGSLNGYRSGYVNFVLENQSLGSPVDLSNEIGRMTIPGLNNYVSYQRNDCLTFGDTISDWYYKNYFEDYIYLFERKNNISNESHKKLFIEFNKNRYGVVNINFEVASSEIEKYIQKAVKYKNDQEKRAKIFPHQTILSFFEYINVKVAEADINSYDLKLSQLEALNQIIDACETPSLNELTLIDYTVRTLGASTRYKGQNVFPFKPYSRLRLFRYYLERKNSIDDHLEEDALFIRNNLYYVLEDFIRAEGNYEPAKFVMKDLGLIK